MGERAFEVAPQDRWWAPTFHIGVTGRVPPRIGRCPEVIGDRRLLDARVTLLLGPRRMEPSLRPFWRTPVELRRYSRRVPDEEIVGSGL